MTITYEVWGRPPGERRVGTLIEFPMLDGDTDADLERICRHAVSVLEARGYELLSWSRRERADEV